MTTTKEIFREYLKRKGLKSTPERNAVLETILSFHNHFNVDELYDLLRKQNKSISHASIYRTLPLLIESGLVSESLRCQGRVSYEHIFGHDHHDHFRIELFADAGEVGNVGHEQRQFATFAADVRRAGLQHTPDHHFGDVFGKRAQATFHVVQRAKQLVDLERG